MKNFFIIYDFAESGFYATCELQHDDRIAAWVSTEQITQVLPDSGIIEKVSWTDVPSGNFFTFKRIVCSAKAFHPALTNFSAITRALFLPGDPPLEGRVLRIPLDEYCIIQTDKPLSAIGFQRTYLRGYEKGTTWSEWQPF